MLKGLTLSVLCMVFLAACSAVKFDYDLQTPFAQMNSYKIERPAKESEALSLDASRIETAIMREMSAKGMASLEQSPALVARYMIEEQSHLESTGTSFGIGFGGSRSAFGVSSPPDLREVKEHRLVLEFIRADTQKVVWKAISERRLAEGMKPEKRTELINKIIAEMFEGYPPGN